MTQNKAIIFDLDGTLADSIPLLIEIVNEQQILGRKLTRADYEQAKNMTIKEAIKKFNIPLWRVPAILVKGRAELTKRINEVPLFEGMDTVLRQLAGNYHLFVMSSNSLVNINKFLEHHNINGLFEKVYGGVSVFGKAKMLKKIITEQGLDPHACYCVGDEVRDIDAANKAGLSSVAVTWGLNGEKSLRARNPDHLVHTPGELKLVFKEKQI